MSLKKTVLFKHHQIQNTSKSRTYLWFYRRGFGFYCIIRVETNALRLNHFSYNISYYEIKEDILNLNKIKYLIYGFVLTHKYANKLQNNSDPIEKKRLRLEYSKIFFSNLNIHIKIKNKEKIPLNGQYLIFSNHRSILDPLAIDIVLKDSKVFGLWVAKKELYNSLLFGKAVRNGGCIRLDRENNNTTLFLSDIKNGLSVGCSICIFPEGTRNKTKKDLLEFKNGLRIIAIKNKLPLLPMYIKSNASETLDKALHDNSIQREITIIIGDIIDYSDKSDLESTYRSRFNLELKS